MSRRRLLAPAIAAALAMGCEPDPLTEIMVIVETDMTVPSELDGFRVEVRDGNESLVHSQSFDLAQQVTLPADFGVLPRDDDASRRITVEVAALRGVDQLFSTRAITTFVEGRKVYLQMFLAERCIGVDCSPNETCRREGCVPVLEPVVFSELPRFSSSTFGSSGRERADEIVVGQESVYIAGIYGSALTLEGAELPAPGGGTGAFLTSRTRAGAHRFTRALPATGLSYLNRVAEAPGGRVEATGYFDGTLRESSTGQTLEAGGPQAAYFVRYTGSGKLEQLQIVGRGSSNVQSFGFARTGDAQRVIGGVHSGGSRFGAGPAVPAAGLGTAGLDDGFVALLDASLGGVWAVGLGGADKDRVTAVATTTNAVYAGGNLTGPAQIGSDALTGAGENGFVARLSLGGAIEWARALSGGADDGVRDVAALPDGGVIVVGATQSTDLAASTLALSGVDPDGFVVALSAEGSPLWGTRLGGLGAAEAWSVTLGQYKTEPVIVVGGTFAGQLVFGDQTLLASGQDLFVALLALDGTPRFAQAIGGAGNEGRAEVGAAQNQILLAGEFADVVGLGSASFASAGGSDVLLVQIAP